MIEPSTIIGATDTGLETLNLLSKIKNFVKNNFLGLKLWVKNPEITIKFSHRIYSNKSIKIGDLFKILKTATSKEKVNLEIKKNDSIEFSFLSEEPVYLISINLTTEDDLESINKIIIWVELRNSLVIDYRDKRRLDSYLESFYHICSILSIIEREKEEVITNLTINHNNIKKEELNYEFFIKRTQITFKKNKLMICSERIPNLRKVIYLVLKKWYSLIKL
jgi:hypothetical protein